MMRYLEHGELPSDQQSARRIVLESSKYKIGDGVLYFENPVVPGKQCVVIPLFLRETLLNEAHSSCFDGILV